MPEPISFWLLFRFKILRIILKTYTIKLPSYNRIVLDPALLVERLANYL
jgi:hypothetical protein